MLRSFCAPFPRSFSRVAPANPKMEETIISGTGKRLMPGDVGRQMMWWHQHGLVKAKLTEKDIVDESFLREALKNEGR